MTTARDGVREPQENLRSIMKFLCPGARYP
ncbi:hypothetical protein QFZ82_006070 [Streptomyces sp. V4I23]|nr:hypothetical protein [Streptomyces sp. V4I23]